MCVAVTPCLQRILRIGGFRTGGVNRARLATLTVGGKAVNAARALSALGDVPLLTGLAGGTHGTVMRSILDRMGVTHDFARSRGETRICTTLFDESCAVVTEIVEEASTPSAAEIDSLLRRAARLARRCGFAAAAGALPPGCPLDLYARLARTAATAGAALVLDAHGPALLAALPHRPRLVKCNREELGRTLRGAAASDARLLEGARELAGRGACWVLVTDGPRAAFLFGGGEGWRLFPPTVKALNNVGSGDSCTAGIVHALLRGREMPEAARFGMACGAANAETLEPGDISPAAARRVVGGVGLRRVP